VARREWPLVVFTLLGQTAVGAFWLAAVPLALKGRGAVEAGGLSVGFFIYGGIAALVGIAAVSSFLHLGRPWWAFLALNNLKNSWLSREILGELLFMFLTAGLAFLEWMRPGCTGRSAILRGVVVVAGFCGLFFLFGMARVYMLDTVPAWRNLHTPASFLVSVLLLGSLASAAYLSRLAGKGGGSGVPSVRFLLQVALAAAIAGLAVTALLTPRVGIFGSRVETLRAPTAGGIVPLLAARGLLLAGVGAAVLLCWNHLDAALLWAAAAGGVAAEGIGRWLFYAVYSRIGV